MNEERKSDAAADGEAPGSPAPSTESTSAESPPASVSETDDGKRSKKDPIVRITRIVLVLCVVVFTWYVLADRRTPATDQARIRSLIVPLVPRVSGAITEVRVGLHSAVEEGDVLFEIDPRTYELAVRSAEAALEQATQQVGAQGATVQSAEARVGVALAQLDRAERNDERVQRVHAENPGALSQKDLDSAETGLSQATERLASAEADLERAKEQLGTEGPDNPQVRSAIAALERARLDLEFSTIRAPSQGYIESFNVDVGHYAAAGQPLATFVSTKDTWIEASYRENNLGNLEPGDRAEIVLDITPGRVYRGTVRSVGYGVSTQPGTSRGDLPTVQASGGWLREPQRFPVIVEFDPGELSSIPRSGSQADIVVYTGDHAILNAIARVRIRLIGLMSYVR